MDTIWCLFVLLLGAVYTVDCLTEAQESAFPRRSCLCDIGIIDHVMIMPIHEKSRPLKNCAVAVEYCKQICGPAVARQILGFRDFSGLEDVTLATKPFWNMQRSLGDLLCQNLGKETSQPLELAVYSQAKSCGRRVPALNGSFAEQRLCCRQDQDSALVRSYSCPALPTTIGMTLLPAPTAVTVNRTPSLPNRTPGLPNRTPSLPSRTPSLPSRTPSLPNRHTFPGSRFSTTTTANSKIPEPIEMHGEMRARMMLQFRQFLDLLHRGTLGQSGKSS